VPPLAIHVSSARGGVTMTTIVEISSTSERLSDPGVSEYQVRTSVDNSARSASCDTSSAALAAAASPTVVIASATTSVF
jgi:hypothetical protein